MTLLKQEVSWLKGHCQEEEGADSIHVGGMLSLNAEKQWFHSQ